MRILVTGAGGMLGSNLVEQASQRDDVEVFGFTRADGDLRFPGTFSEILNSFQPHAFTFFDMGVRVSRYGGTGSGVHDVE